MDISDILEGINTRSLDHDPFADNDGDAYGLGSRGQAFEQADLQALTRAWVNERGTAELLP
jgi:GINS complex subunit 4